MIKVKRILRMSSEGKKKKSSESSRIKSKSNSKKRDFHKELILNKWMMGFFHGGSLTTLKERLGEDRFEGIDEDGQTKFFHELSRNLFQIDRITESELRRYDLHIVEYWNRITKGRNRAEGTVLHLKYFQYLSLLFTEIYLDWYFNKRQELFDGLNREVEEYNEKEKAEFHFEPYELNDLNKIAFWNATGSGKTLLLHVNIYQYLHYFQKGNSNIYPDKIILLTPNEGLSRQHLFELELSGFQHARMFSSEKHQAHLRTIEIIDIKKLRDEEGDKTVAAESFEGNNLVLVDEGHLGTGTADGAWIRRRETLISAGFAFEYSATFGQAVSKAKTIKKALEEKIKAKAKVLFSTTKLNTLTDEQRETLHLTEEEKRTARNEAMREVYAKCVLFDYSYKYFYNDGYGKDSLILNLKDSEYEDPETKGLYYTACLLSFYQQQYLWETRKEALTSWNIEKPLWVFVGNTVNSEDSDILQVVNFLAAFISETEQHTTWISDLKSNTARLLDAKGRNIFEKRFEPLINIKAEEIYSDILKRLFNTSSKQRLKLVNLKGTKGEYVLQLGSEKPFGLISIGDGASFFKDAESEENKANFDTHTDEFDSSLFSQINIADSSINILIGSRKFTEGWSSWRVSTMGLLNMGKGEGSQIIQLFGRGVRLKGRDYSLKRSTPTERKNHQKQLYLEKLETLHIFGVNAGYMATFKDYLNEEGVITSDEIIELDFPTKSNLPKQRLNTLAIKDGYRDNQLHGFKRKVSPYLYEVPAEFKGKIKSPSVELDLYPRIEALRSDEKKDKEKAGSKPPSIKEQCKISKELFPFFDFQRIYLEVQNFKQENHLSNLRLELSRLKDFCFQNTSWYTLLIPKSEMELRSFESIKKQEDILIQLLKDYTERFYRTLKLAYESQHYDIVPIKEDDSSILKLYQFEIEHTDEGLEYEKRLNILKELVKKGDFLEIEKANQEPIVAICFNSLLYYPLINLSNKETLPFKMRPLAFDNDWEATFVNDLKEFTESKNFKEILGNKSLYLLRNASHKSKGLGFALAGNFYPDFLLWLVDDSSGKQWLSFIDPKGIRNLNLSDPKLNLYKEVKIIEEKLADPNLILNAFILTHTDYEDLINVSIKKEELEDRHILFVSEGREEYLRKMFERVV
jgi:hypothetical protein